MLAGGEGLKFVEGHKFFREMFIVFSFAEIFPGIS